MTGGICRLLESRVLRSGRAAAGSGSWLMCLMLFCEEAVREAMHQASKVRGSALVPHHILRPTPTVLSMWSCGRQGYLRAGHHRQPLGRAGGRKYDATSPADALD